MHFGENHLENFALKNLLSKQMALTKEPCCVVNVSLKLHDYGRIRFNDINFEKIYPTNSACSQGKLAYILFTTKLN